MIFWVSPEFPCTFIGFKNDFLSFPFVSPELPCTFLGFKYDIFRYPWLSPEFPQNFTFFRYGTEKKSLKLAKPQTNLSPEFPPSEFPQTFTEATFGGWVGVKWILHNVMKYRFSKVLGKLGRWKLRGKIGLRFSQIKWLFFSTIPEISKVLEKLRGKSRESQDMISKASGNARKLWGKSRETQDIIS